MKSILTAVPKFAIVALIFINSTVAKPKASPVEFYNPDYITDDVQPRASAEYEPPGAIIGVLPAVTASSHVTAPPQTPLVDSQFGNTEYEEEEDVLPEVPVVLAVIAIDVPPTQVPSVFTEATDAPRTEVPHPHAPSTGAEVTSTSTPPTSAPPIPIPNASPAGFTYTCPEVIAVTEFATNATEAPTTASPSPPIGPATEPFTRLEISNSFDQVKRQLVPQFRQEYPPCNPTQTSKDLFSTTRLDNLLTKISVLREYSTLPLAPTYEALLNAIIYSPYVCAQDYVRLASIVNKEYQLSRQTKADQNTTEAWDNLRHRFNSKIWDLFEANKTWKIVPVGGAFSAALMIVNVSCPTGEGLTLIKTVEDEDESARWYLIPSESGSYFQVQNAKFGIYFKGSYSQMHGNGFSHLMLVPSQDFLRKSDQNIDLEFYIVRTEERATFGIESWVKLNETVAGDDEIWALKRNDDTYQGAALFRLEK